VQLCILIITIDLPLHFHHIKCCFVPN
jgi:hypothetical protein